MRGHERGGAGEPVGVSRAAARDDRETDLVGTRVRNAVGKGAVITVRLYVSHASRRTTAGASSGPRCASRPRQCVRDALDRYRRARIARLARVPPTL